MAEASPTMRIRALRQLDVDGVQIAEGEEADIRRELVADLVACGAADDEIEARSPEAGAADGGGAATGAATEEAQLAARDGVEGSGDAPAPPAPPAARLGKKR